MSPVYFYPHFIELRSASGLHGDHPTPGPIWKHEYQGSQSSNEFSVNIFSL